MQRSNLKDLEDIVSLVTSLPRREPKPVPPQDPDWREKLMTKLAMNAKDAAKESTEALHRIVIGALVGERLIADSVPVRHVPTILQCTLQNLIVTSMDMGRFPFHVYATGVWQTTIDWGHGRCITLKSSLYLPTEMNEDTKGAITVVEGHLEDPNPFGIPVDRIINKENMSLDF